MFDYFYVTGVVLLAPRLTFVSPFSGRIRKPAFRAGVGRLLLWHTHWFIGNKMRFMAMRQEFLPHGHAFLEELMVYACSIRHTDHCHRVG